MATRGDAERAGDAGRSEEAGADAGRSWDAGRDAERSEEVGDGRQMDGAPSGDPPCPWAPAPDARVGFLHAGRMGASIAVAMRNAGYAVTAVSRRDLGAARSVADRLDGALATKDDQEVVDAVDVVFVTTVDAAIEPTVRALRFRRGQAVLHGSGATPVAVLESARGGGALIGGFHPLQSLTDEHGESLFAGVTFGIEAADPGLFAWLSALAGALGGGGVRLSASTRAAYHASGTMASSLVSGLVALAADLWRELGVARHEALAALGPLLLTTARQITVAGIPQAMTGAYVRGDVATVASHLEALADDDVRHAYAALALAQLPIAAEQGNISEQDRAAIEEILRRALG